MAPDGRDIGLDLLPVLVAQFLEQERFDRSFVGADLKDLHFDAEFLHQPGEEQGLAR